MVTSTATPVETGNRSAAVHRHRLNLVLAVRAALGMVADDEQLRAVLLPVGDGLLAAVKL